MFSTNATYYLLRCLDEEIVNAEKWGKTYASNHEAYAVLKEEVEEADGDLDAIKYSLDTFWNLVKVNADKDCMEQTVKDLKDTAYSMAKEAIQVTAVCYKVLKTLEKKE